MLANSDEMHCAVFHRDLHCLQKYKFMDECYPISQTRVRNYNASL